MPKKVKRKRQPSEVPSEKAGAAFGQIFTLEALVLENGSCPVEDWLKDIRDTQTKQRVQSRLDRVERGNLGDCRFIGEGVAELRLDFGPGYRIYYAQAGPTQIVLLVGGDKSTQDRDIALAQSCGKTTKMRLKDTDEMFSDDLRDPAYAAGYLNITLEDDGIEGFLYALQKVARAHGVSRVASGSDLPRESLYRALSEKGNPGIRPLARVLDTLGLRLTVTPAVAEAADVPGVVESQVTADQPVVTPERRTQPTVSSGVKEPVHTS